MSQQFDPGRSPDFSGGRTSLSWPRPPLTWKRVATLVTLAAYGPFFTMALHTLVFVSCGHCKKVAWLLLPAGPGILPLELLRHAVDFPRPNDGWTWTLGFILAGIGIGAATFLARKGRAWLFCVVAVVILGCSLSAIGLLSAIRS